MERFILSKDSVKDFLSVLQNYELVAPVAKDGVTVFEPITNPQEAVLDLLRQPHPPKRFIFPQTEVLFTFDKKDGIKEPKPRDGQKQRIIFGIRPCDARGLCIIDPVFEKEYADPYYLEKRQSTIFVGVQCSQPYPNCFCTSVGGNPSSSEGLDLLLFDLGESYLFEVFTPKGEQIVKEASSMLSAPSAEQEKGKEDLQREAEGKLRRSVNIDGISKKIEEYFEHSIWKEIAEKCISCGICTFTCPTCHCFDIQDERVKGKGKRLRIWDSCMFSEYTLHASGHNPRPTRAERLRNRMHHKFKHTIDLQGVPGCVGCGRCIGLCPAHEDLIENLQVLQSL